MKDIAEVKIYRKASDHFIYVKSPWLESHFKTMSEAQLGSVRTSEVNSANEVGSVYEFYKIRTLPSTPYSLQANWDVLNNYGYLRGVGITNGIDVPVCTPITKSMAAETVQRIQIMIQYLYDAGAGEDTNVTLAHVTYQSGE